MLVERNTFLIIFPKSLEILHVLFNSLSLIIIRVLARDITYNLVIVMTHTRLKTRFLLYLIENAITDETYDITFIVSVCHVKRLHLYLRTYHSVVEYDHVTPIPTIHVLLMLVILEHPFLLSCIDKIGYHEVQRIVRARYHTAYKVIEFVCLHLISITLAKRTAKRFIIGWRYPASMQCRDGISQMLHDRPEIMRYLTHLHGKGSVYAEIIVIIVRFYKIASFRKAYHIYYAECNYS